MTDKQFADFLSVPDVTEFRKKVFFVLICIFISSMIISMLLIPAEFRGGVATKILEAQDVNSRLVTETIQKYEEKEKRLIRRMLAIYMATKEIRDEIQE